MASWTVVRDGSRLLLPFHAELPDGWHADGAVAHSLANDPFEDAFAAGASLPL
ncbi:hypothetical protein [Nonomuraea diastatica]|uniref:hypothetical protein n=1 Tax=Nonomuraea diastatica TaxID=1848329 RepID=UPI00140C4F1B|nr:hypothetical protein [Nonomuraea diastatica]